MPVTSFEISTIGYKLSLILGIAGLLSILFAQRRPFLCSNWLRTSLIAALVLPIAVWYSPTVDLPVLPQSSTTPTDNAHKSLPDQALVSSLVSDAQDGVLVAHQRPEGSDDRLPTTPAADDVYSVSKLQAGEFQQLSPSLEHHSFCFDWGKFLWTVYLVVVCILTLKTCAALLQLSVLRRACTHINDSEWQTVLSHRSVQLKIARSVQLLQSDDVTTPVTFGWRRPTIVVPRRYASSYSPAEREAIVVHELNHIARNDFFWQLASRVLAAVYWFHPLTWFLRRESDRLHERVCDLRCVDALEGELYARALVTIAAKSQGMRSIGLGMAMAHHSSLGRRLEELQSAGFFRRQGRATGALIVTFAALVLALVVFGRLTNRAVRLPTSPLSHGTSAERNHEGDMIVEFESAANDNGHMNELRASRDVIPTSLTLPENHPVGGEAEDDVLFVVHRGFLAQVAVRVNDEPIFNCDLLDAWALQLHSIRSRMRESIQDEIEKAASLLDDALSSEELAGRLQEMTAGVQRKFCSEYRQYMTKAAQMVIGPYVQKVLLVQLLKSRQTPEEAEQFNAYIDEQFKKEILNLMKQLKVDSEADLQAALKQKSSSLQRVRKNFALDRLVMEFIRQESMLATDAEVDIAESDILERYKADVIRFTGSMARFQTLTILKSSPGSKQRIEQARERLLSRTADDVFTQIFPGESDPWKVEEHQWWPVQFIRSRHLGFELTVQPLNQWSPVLEFENEYRLIRVLDRSDQVVTPLEAVRDEIAQKLTEERRSRQLQEFLRQIVSTATIETTYDLKFFNGKESIPTVN